MTDTCYNRVFICGGSKGIGLETAKLYASRGADVCIVARDQKALSEAINEISSVCTSPSQKFSHYSLDATNESKVNQAVEDYVQANGIPDLLINNVGYSYPQYANKLKLEDYRTNMDINYYGQLVPTLAFLPHFLKAGKGHISFTSSMMGYFGIIGFAAYAPTKFALVGLAEVLRHELKPKNIGISILYPPDTLTPGFEKENETKPVECARMSGTVKAMTAESVAEIFVRGLEKQKYQIFPGEAWQIWLLNRLVPRLVRFILDRDYKKILSDLNK